MDMTCPHCGAPVPDYARFCTACGAPAGRPTQDTDPRAESDPLAGLDAVLRSADAGQPREPLRPRTPRPGPASSPAQPAPPVRPEPVQTAPVHATPAPPAAYRANPAPSVTVQVNTPDMHGPWGQRFTFDGNFFEYFLISLALGVLSVCTFGLALPYFFYWSIKYFFTKLRISNRRVVYRGNFGEYFFTALGLIIASVVTFGILLPYYAYWSFKYFFTRLELEG